MVLQTFSARGVYVCVGGGQGDFEAREQIASRVDVALAAETSRHFGATEDAHCLDWKSLFRQQSLERDSFNEEIVTQLEAVCHSAQTPLPGEDVLQERMDELVARPPPLDSAEAFAEEERRLWWTAQRDMAENERMHLETAFAIQLRRVDAEWSSHEEQMRVDYLAQRSEIEGRSVAKTVVVSPSGPWKSREKQSRLIHTAPVHQPRSPTLHNPKEGEKEGKSEGSGSGDTSIRQQSVSASELSSEVEVQFEELEAAYAAARNRVKYQKHNATRWITRQSQRMLIQVGALERNKKLLAEHLEREDQSLKESSLRITAFVDTLVERGRLPPSLKPQQNQLQNFSQRHQDQRIPGGSSTAAGGNFPQRPDFRRPNRGTGSGRE